VEKKIEKKSPKGLFFFFSTVARKGRWGRAGNEPFPKPEFTNRRVRGSPPMVGDAAVEKR